MRCLLLASLLLVPIAARAETFTIDVSAAGFTGSATLTGTSNGGGTYRIGSIASPVPVTVIAPNDPFFGNDNLLFLTGARLFDVNGLAFSGSFGTGNFFSTVSGYEVQGFDADNSFFDVPVSVRLTSASVTPEPSSVVLAATGLMAIAAAAFYRRHPAFTASTLA